MVGSRVVLTALLLAGCDAVFGLRDLPDVPGPDAPLPPERWSQVDGGTSHTCGIRVDRTLWCWGRNDHGQLGLGRTPRIPEVTEPRQVGSGTRWATVSASGETTCALDLDGSLWCWGRNEHGQVGDGLTGDDDPRFDPFQIPGAWTAVSNGPRHTCAIDADAALWCWGKGSDGERGDATNVADVPLPTAVVGGHRFTAVGAGGRATCAIQPDRSLWCWGNNGDGQVGIGKPPDRTNTPTRVAGEAWVELALGESFACGRQENGVLRCWGANQFGQLGDGTTTRREVPTAVDNDQIADWRHISAGADHVCGARASGELLCWGGNRYGELVVEPAIAVRSTPAISGSGSWSSIGLGAQHTCAIDTAGELWCAGYAATGALGFAEGSHPLPTPVAGDWTVASTGDHATCAIDRTTSAVSCWGFNGEGLVGDATVRDRALPMPVAGDLGMIVALDLGDHALALDATAQRWGWGANTSAQLAIGSLANQTSPIVQTGGTAWRQLSASRSHSCGINSASELYCWGRNAELQTGHLPGMPFPFPPVLTPTKVAGAWSRVSTGIDHTCAIKADTKVYCWGHNGFGQLGVASPTTHVPQAIGITGVAFDAVHAGGKYSCARSGARAYCWGANTSGQLGDGTTTLNPVPTPITGDWRELALGEFHACGIRTDGTLWCWGQNGYGQLGIASLLDRSTPTQVGSETDWSTLDAGRGHTCATRASNGLWCWGANLHGALGDGTAWRSELARVAR